MVVFDVQVTSCDHITRHHVACKHVAMLCIRRNDRLFSSLFNVTALAGKGNVSTAHGQVVTGAWQ